MFDVCVVGSANLDLVATADRLPRPGETVLGAEFHQHPGGKGLNQAVAAARSGASVAFVGAIGVDEAATTLRAVLAAESIDASGVTEVEDRPTGRALITVDRRGENVIVVAPGANGALTSPQLPAARVVLAQLEIPAAAVLEALRAARNAGATTILNPAPAPVGGLDAVLVELLEVVDVLVPNEHEVELLGGVARLRDAGVRTVIVTCGAAGAEVTSGVESWTQHSIDVDVIDTTGAGDAFCGSLAARLAAGDDLRAAVAWGVAAGALATTVAGAVPSLPRSVTIAELVDSGGPRRSPQ